MDKGGGGQKNPKILQTSYLETPSKTKRLLVSRVRNVKWPRGVACRLSSGNSRHFFHSSGLLSLQFPAWLAFSSAGRRNWQMDGCHKGRPVISICWQWRQSEARKVFPNFSVLLNCSRFFRHCCKSQIGTSILDF